MLHDRMTTVVQQRRKTTTTSSSSSSFIKKFIATAYRQRASTMTKKIKATANDNSNNMNDSATDAMPRAESKNASRGEQSPSQLNTSSPSSTSSSSSSSSSTINNIAYDTAVFKCAG